MEYGVNFGSRASSEEEKRKRRELFAQNQRQLGLTGMPQQSALVQQAPAAAPQKPLIQNQLDATATARADRQAADRQAAAQQAATQTARQQQALTQAKAIAAMPVKQQQPAVAQLKASQQQAIPATTPATAPQSRQATPATAKPLPMGMNDVLSAASIRARAPSPSAADNTSKPVKATNIVDAVPGTKVDTTGAEKPIYSADNSPISEEQGSKSYGLSIIPTEKTNAAQDFAAALNNGQSINVDNPNVPKRGIQGINERDALIKQASTIQEGARGLTATQMNILANLQGNDDKFANDQYSAQLGAASQMQQTQLRENNANARAALGEVSASERQQMQQGYDADKFQQQLGFDADKFQQSTALDSRRLDITQSDSDVKNFSTKERNRLYKEWEIAETPEEQSAIMEKINTLSGTGGDEKWKAIKGAQTIEGGLPVDGAPLLLNERTGETRPIDSAPISLDMSNPKVAAIMSNTKTTYEQKMAELDALGVVTQ